MASEMHVTLYERFSENDAKQFLKLETRVIQQLRNKGEISFLQLPDGQIEYFGIHLLTFLLSLTRSASKQNDTGKTFENISIVRLPEVTKVTGLSRTTIWRYEKEGLFPTRISLGGGSIGWYQSDIHHWMTSRKRQSCRWG